MDADCLILVENFFAGWNAIGVATQPQPNGGDCNGVFYGAISLTAKNQSRSSASDAYYRPIAGKRSNFHLITGHLVTKINFDSKKKAVSVNVSIAFVMNSILVQLSYPHSTRRATPRPPSLLKLATKSFWLQELLTVLKSCSYRALDQRSCFPVSRLKRWPIFPVLGATSRIKHQCLCNTLVSKLIA